MTNILGVVAHTMGYGDSCAALSVNGKIVGVIEEERFSRRRYDEGFPGDSVKALLAIGGIPGSQVDVVSLHMHPLRGIANRTYWALRHPVGALINAWDYQRYAVKHRKLRSQLKEALGSDRFEVEYYGHHACHAAASFYASPFKRAAFLTLDGSGEGVTGSFGVSDKKTGINIMGVFPYPHSLGMAYAAVCDHIGFPAPSGPGKIMALAAYGDKSRFKKLLNTMIGFKNGKLTLDLKYFEFHKNWVTPLSDKRWLSKTFEKKSGISRRGSSNPLEQEHIDLAAALQARANDLGIAISRYVADVTGERNFFLAGGVALNSVMNGAIYEAGLFKNVFVQPAAGDAGNSVGSIFLSSLANDKAVPLFNCIPYAGPEYSNEMIKSELDSRGLKSRKSDNVAFEAASSIKDGKIVGWFQGRMEYGPRALGCRSILADPQKKEMREIINQKVKHREWFRPFAPSVTQEAYSAYFTGPEDNPYMLVVAYVREQWRDIFPSVTHVDGSTRVQSVSAKNNPKFHALLTYLGQINNHPVALNTSFNDQEPIVCSPADAVKCFLNTDIDSLYIGDYVVDTKTANAIV